MNNISQEEIKEYVEKNIGTFHQSRLDNLAKLKLENVLKRKNPYLYKAKNILKSQDLVESILNAHLSSQEEGIFGNFLEGLARYVANKTYGGVKSTTLGMDLDFTKDNVRYIVTIKSGPNWGNSEQISAMKASFTRAKKSLRTSNSNLNIIAVNGCCYGRDTKPDKGEYFKYCGQTFWEFISGNPILYTEIIEPLGNKAKEKNEEFIKQHARIVNTFTAQFCEKFCKDGIIDWESLVRFNSSTSKLAKTKKGKGKNQGKGK
jgi:hypothetical protein